MRLKYSKTLIESQPNESPIADLCWSPNGVKLAVATCDRQVLLFDSDGERRDKFSTKPADPAAGKKSYTITGLCFNGTSELLAVAQSDNMVFVYRLGADWASKKVICNKFPLSGAPTKIVPGDNGFYIGTTDGKVRSLECKSNKSTSMWSCGACCVALSGGGGGRPLASGHVDGAVFVNGRLLMRYALPPTVLVLQPPYLIVGSCDGRLCVYEASRGTLIQTVEAPLAPDARDILSVAVNPSPQTIAFGTSEGILMCDVSESGRLSLSTLALGAGSWRALAWSADGARLVAGCYTGAVVLLNAVLRRWVWRDSVEIRHLSPRQLLLTRLAKDAPTMTVSSDKDIHNVRLVGNDWYAVCRTNSSLVLCDIARGLTSEIPWQGSGERVYAGAGGACLIHRAGELSIVEYGLNQVLHTVRTERVNPHVISVRINEAKTRGDDEESKRLAYLLDRQTVAVLDLVTGGQLGQWWHEARVDWLELNESGHLLGVRDTRRRLALLNLVSGGKEIVASGVGFVQWVENSDALIAQTPTHILVWYSGWDCGAVDMIECNGDAIAEVNGKKILLENGNSVLLDEHRLAFNSALRTADLSVCAKYLEGVDANTDVTPLWGQLAERALANNDLQLSAKCYRELGDDARTFFMERVVELARDEGHGSVDAGLQSPLVQAQLYIYNGDLQSAAEQYTRRSQRPTLAVDMYTQYNRWTDAIAVAEKHDRDSVPVLKERYMEYLMGTGRVSEAASVLASTGDANGAVKLLVKARRGRAAAALLMQHPQLITDTDMFDAVMTLLVQEEWWESAAELCERAGDTATAIQYYAKGHNYARAVQLAKEKQGASVTELELEWGRHLVGGRQAAAAVSHLLEAGDTRAALAAALRAHRYRRARDILQIIEDKESIKDMCEQVGDHFISIRDWETAEQVFSESGMPEKCVVAYNEAGLYAEGLKFAAKHLSEEQARDIYLPLAQKLRDEGQLRKAEQIYIGLGEHDEAITMYKEASQYEWMLRLVSIHRPSLLEATRRHVAQALQARGDLREAETYYLQAGDWKSAIQMYRAANQWEVAERIARAHAPPAVHQQVCMVWAGQLGGAAAARLLAARGLAAMGAQWAVQAQRWDIASELSELGGGISKREISRLEAVALSAERPEEAEAAFLRADAPDDAVRMWLARGRHQRALDIAEQHATHMVEEVLVESGRAAAERGDLAQFEALMIRANRPREVVQHYKDLELWEEATRVAREYLPDSAEPVPPSVPPLLQEAADFADRGSWWSAVWSLCAASAAAAAAGSARLSERAALRAARLTRDRLLGSERRRAARLLAQRFAAIGQSDVGEQLKAALSEGYEGEDENQARSQESEEESLADNPVASSSHMDPSTENLERLARGQQWERCLAQAGDRVTHYALRYAKQLFSQPLRAEDTDIDSEEVPENLSTAIDVLSRYFNSQDSRVSTSDVSLSRAVCSELLMRVSVLPKAYDTLKAVASLLLELGAEDKILQAAELLLALWVPALAGRAARALPRYSDILVADVALYISGKTIREEGSSGVREAFVFLNRCLDLAEAADDDAVNMLDHTDFECTDWPSAPLLLEAACVRGAALKDAREWVLAVSVDHAVHQSLPLDERGVYASNARGEACCVLSGHPLGSRLVTFTNGRCCNREAWSRVSGGGGGGGGGGGARGRAAELLRYVTLWCGPADYTPL